MQHVSCSQLQYAYTALQMCCDVCINWSAAVGNARDWLWSSARSRESGHDDTRCMGRPDAPYYFFPYRYDISAQRFQMKLEVRSWEYRSVILCWVNWVENVLLIYYASSDLFVCLHWKCLFTLEKNPRFTAFLDSNLHTRLAIVTENELGLAFLPKNLRKKISSRSVHVLFSYRGDKQTNRQTDRQTNADKK